MSIRSKSRRRLVVLLLIVGVLGVSLGGAAAALRWHRQRLALQQRAEGIEAVEAGQYVSGLNLLGRYLQRSPSDAGALYHYALARLHVPAPERRHLAEACGTMYRSYRLDPSNREAQQHLLELFTRAGGATEALNMAQTVLGREPDNVAAMYLRAFALQQLHRLPEATTAAEQVVAADPAHFQGHRLLLQILQQSVVRDGQLIELAEQYQRQNSQDPSFRLLLAITYTAVERREQALAQLRTIEAWTPDSPALVGLLASQWRAVGCLDESLAALERAADRLADLEVRDELAWRLWQAGHFEDLLRRTESLDVNDPQQTPELLAYRALALLANDRKVEAQAVVDALSKQPTVAVARAWTLVLRTQLDDQPASPKALIAACRVALESDAGNPLAHYLIGQAEAELGESELAISSWENAIKAAPLWRQPYLRVAQALLDAGRTAQAIKTATILNRIAPTDAAAGAVVARIWFAGLEDGELKDSEGLLVLLDALRRAVPDDESLLVLRVQTLGLMGRRDEARAVIEQALDAKKPLQRQTLASLAECSWRYSLGIEQPCMQAASQGGPLTPQIALGTALLLHRQGSDEGQAVAVLATPAEAGDRQAAQWALARAQYAEQTQPAPEAAAQFAALADGHPQLVDAQQAVLQSPAAWSDLDLIERTIGRLENLTGDLGLSWKVARARYLLARQASQKDLADAVSVLELACNTAPQMIPARLLLASALERTGNLNGAIENLNIALAQRANMPQVRLDLARLLDAAGQDQRAAAELDSVLNAKKLEASVLRQAASLLARNDLSRAVGLLEEFHQQNPQDAESTLLLASFYRRQNQSDKTAALCKTLLEHPSISAIRFAADFYASTGQPREAEGALDQLAGLKLPPGTNLMVRAQYALTHETTDRALELLQQAVAQAPQDPRTWQALIGVRIRAGQAQAAAETTAQAAAACPGSRDLRSLDEQSGLIERFAADETLRPLLTALLEEPAHRLEAVAALGAAAEAADGGKTPQEVTSLLRQFADRHPRFLTLQTVVANRYLRQNQPEIAVELASRAVQGFPEAVEPAALAAQSLASAGRWPEALAAAQNWRRRTGGATLAPDLMISQARLRMNDPQQALQQLQPYLDQALKHPDDYGPVLLAQAQALMSCGRHDQAAQLLTPLLGRGPAWRQAWVQLATASLPDAARAAEWLRQVQPLMPEGAMDEQVLLARAWYSLGTRADNDDYRAQGKGLLENLTSRADAGVDAIFNLALVFDMEGDLAAAEKRYRQALAQKSDHGPAANNLAMVLAHQGGEQRLAEAAELAGRAVAAVPDSAAFYDTLAFIQIRLKQLDAATQSLRSAVRLEPQNLQWQARLAAVLRDAGRLPEACEIARNISPSDPRLRDLSPEERQTLASLKDTMAAVKPSSS